MMLYTANRKLGIFNVTIKNQESEFRFIAEINTLDKNVLLDEPYPDYGTVLTYKTLTSHRNHDE